jgi:predicted PurR-regulated permease PerM
VSLAVGVTAGIGLWILGVTGVFPAGKTYALVFAAFAAVVEIIPYVGPWLGALAPLAVAATQSGTAVIAVALLFLFIHQIEGHIIVPKLMGGAVKVHPLVVIFALLAAGELYGLAGVLLAMPLVAIGREVSAFLLERIGLERWRGGPIALEVGVEDIGGRGDDPADDRPAPVPAAGE